MNLYLLEQSNKNRYEIYDSIIVCAESESDAITIKPSNNIYEWADNDNITCKFIGTASTDLKRGIIHSSYTGS